MRRHSGCRDNQFAEVRRMVQIAGDGTKNSIFPSVAYHAGKILIQRWLTPLVELDVPDEGIFLTDLL